MIRCAFLLRVPALAFAFAFAFVVGCGCSEPAERVILVSIDTLRADQLGSYGAQRARTPSLDALAARGVRFDAAISPVPLTLPSHASLMTALDPPRHGVHNNATFVLRDDIPVLAEAMRAAGFATGAFVGAAVLDRHYGLARGFDHYDDQMELARTGSATSFAERPADRVVDAALGWLESAPDRFLLWVHLYDPHTGYDPPPGFAAALPGRPYAGEVAFSDAQVGRLLDAVQARWSAGDGTLVVVTSDHGESLGEHGEATHGYTVYDATQRIPLLIAGPGIPAGAVVDELVRLVDVAPTILAWAGLAPLPGVDGRDLRPLFQDPEPGAPARRARVAYVETLIPRIDFGWSPIAGVRTAQYKFIRTRRPELYDLGADPAELDDLAAERPDVVAELDALLEERIADAPDIVAMRTPSEEERLRLESLGYVVGDGSSSALLPLRLGDVEGPDGKDMLPRMSVIYGPVREQIAAGNGAAALALLEQAGSLGARGVQVHLVSAQAALLAGDPERALRHAQTAVRLTPDWASSHELLAQVLEVLDRAEASRAEYERARVLDPGSPGPTVGLGRLAEAAGRREQAAALYARATEGRRRSLEARWRLAALHIEDGRRDQADAILAAASAGSLGSFATIRLAAAEHRAGDSAAATQRVQRAVEESGASKTLLALLEELLRAQDRNEEADAVGAQRAALAQEID